MRSAQEIWEDVPDGPICLQREVINAIRQAQIEALEAAKATVPEALLGDCAPEDAIFAVQAVTRSRIERLIAAIKKEGE